MSTPHRPVPSRAAGRRTPAGAPGGGSRGSPAAASRKVGHQSRPWPAARGGRHGLDRHHPGEGAKESAGEDGRQLTLVQPGCGAPLYPVSGIRLGGSRRQGTSWTERLDHNDRRFRYLLRIHAGSGSHTAHEMLCNVIALQGHPAPDPKADGHDSARQQRPPLRSPPSPTGADLVFRHRARLRAGRHGPTSRND
jgi:hypothetical protein